MLELGFWKKINKGFLALAPMADVTDAAFRRMFVKYGKPDVFWTEFVSADGLASAGRDALKINLIYSKKEKPIVAQLFSSNHVKMREATKYVATLGFDGIDINMGCPDKSVEKQGAGAAMMKSMEKAGEIIQAVKDGFRFRAYRHGATCMILRGVHGDRDKFTEGLNQFRRGRMESVWIWRRARAVVFKYCEARNQPFGNMRYVKPAEKCFRG